MSTIFVWTMTLMPALVSLVVVIGIPVTLGALLLREFRPRWRETRHGGSPFLYDASRHTGRFRSLLPGKSGARRKAISA